MKSEIRQVNVGKEDALNFRTDVYLERRAQCERSPGTGDHFGIAEEPASVATIPQPMVGSSEGEQKLQMEAQQLPKEMENLVGQLHTQV
jgi:hypothetical protein